jgi:peptide/nickel transport system substrate-binding protein
VVRRDDYNWSSDLALHDGPAYVERIEYTYLPVPSVRAGALASGQIDVAVSLEGPDVPTVEAAGYNLDAKTMPGFPGTLLMNPLRLDLPIRKAIMIGIDREDIVQTVLGDHFNPARSIMTSNLPQFVDHSEDLARNVDEAGRILDEAGWTMGPDGVRMRDGETLDITIRYNESSGAFYTPLLQLVQQQLNEVGFNTTLDLINPADNDRVQLEYDYDLYLLSITEGDPDMVRAMLVESAADPALLDQIGLTPLMDEQAAVTGDERKEVWAEMQDIIIENALWTPIFEAAQITGSAPNVTGIRSDLKGMLTFYDTGFTG